MAYITRGALGELWRPLHESAPGMAICLCE